MRYLTALTALFALILFALPVSASGIVAVRIRVVVPFVPAVAVQTFVPAAVAIDGCATAAFVPSVSFSSFAVATPVFQTAMFAQSFVAVNVINRVAVRRSLFPIFGARKVIRTRTVIR